MENILKSLGISENTINQMMEVCPEIKDLEKEEIINKVNILKSVGCEEYQIRNIISSNVYYLNRSDTDVNKLIKKLEEKEFEYLDLLFDGNPHILNLDDFEIELYIKEREKNGEILEDIVDDMSSNLILFDNI